MSQGGLSNAFLRYAFIFLKQNVIPFLLIGTEKLAIIRWGENCFGSEATSAGVREHSGVGSWSLRLFTFGCGVSSLE